MNRIDYSKWDCLKSDSEEEEEEVLSKRTSTATTEVEKTERKEEKKGKIWNNDKENNEDNRGTENSRMNVEIKEIKERKEIKGKEGKEIHEDKQEEKEKENNHNNKKEKKIVKEDIYFTSIQDRSRMEIFYNTKHTADSFFREAEEKLLYSSSKESEKLEKNNDKEKKDDVPECFALYEKAVDIYKSLIMLLQADSTKKKSKSRGVSQGQKEQEERNTLLICCFMNACASSIRLKKFDLVVDLCASILRFITDSKGEINLRNNTEKEKKWYKIYQFRAYAYMELELFSKALKDYEMIFDILQINDEEESLKIENNLWQEYQHCLRNLESSRTAVTAPIAAVAAGGYDEINNDLLVSIIQQAQCFLQNGQIDLGYNQLISFKSTMGKSKKETKGKTKTTSRGSLEDFIHIYKTAPDDEILDRVKELPYLVEFYYMLGQFCYQRKEIYEAVSAYCTAFSLLQKQVKRPSENFNRTRAYIEGDLGISLLVVYKQSKRNYENKNKTPPLKMLTKKEKERNDSNKESDLESSRKISISAEEEKDSLDFLLEKCTKHMSEAKRYYEDKDSNSLRYLVTLESLSDIYVENKNWENAIQLCMGAIAIAMKLGLQERAVTNLDCMGHLVEKRRGEETSSSSIPSFDEKKEMVKYWLKASSLCLDLKPRQVYRALTLNIQAAEILLNGSEDKLVPILSSTLTSGEDDTLDMLHSLYQTALNILDRYGLEDQYKKYHNEIENKLLEGLGKATREAQECYECLNKLVDRFLSNINTTTTKHNKNKDLPLLVSVSSDSKKEMIELRLKVSRYAYLASIASGKMSNLPETERLLAIAIEYSDNEVEKKMFLEANAVVERMKGNKNQAKSLLLSANEESPLNKFNAVEEDSEKTVITATVDNQDEHKGEMEEVAKNENESENNNENEKEKEISTKLEFLKVEEKENIERKRPAVMFTPPAEFLEERDRQVELEKLEREKKRKTEIEQTKHQVESNWILNHINKFVSGKK